MTNPEIQNRLRLLPGVDQLLRTEPIVALLAEHPRHLVLNAIRQVLEETRAAILAGCEGESGPAPNPSELFRLCTERVDQLSQYTLQPVINATGIVVHTNLGRSLLPRPALERLDRIGRGYNNLEYDVRQGRRGSRYVHAEDILREITGAEAALVVNNNAAAVLLVLGTIAPGLEVIVSRGQMVEIGGAFRIPDVMAASGAVLREVGCTNRTHLRDYEAAINERTAMLLKVHCSNYRIVGFTAEFSLKDLVALGRGRGLPVMEDLGSGCFVDLSPFGLYREPTVRETVQTGVDVVTFSGDKLLGGPQAGIILGSRDIVQRCKKNPLTRALRVDKMTLAALEATLRLYRDQREALNQVPTLRMISVPLETLRARAENLSARLARLEPRGVCTFAIEESVSQVGGGSLPAQDLPTWVVAVRSSQWSAARLEAALRRRKPPLIGRIEADRLLMDVRTLADEDPPLIEAAFAALLTA